MKRLILIITSSVFGLGLLAPSISAQTGYSTDVLASGTTYAELGFWSGWASHPDGGSQEYTPRISHGLRHNVEIGIGTSSTNPDFIDYPAFELQPGVKWRFYNNETNGLAAAGGATLFIPIIRRSGQDTFVMLHGNVSQQMKIANGMRVTVGAYTLVGRSHEFGARSGINLMYEQPLTRKLSFSTQWFSGNNRFGYVTPGFTPVLPHESNLYLGYSFGNEGRNNHGPFASYGIQF
jgi:hypothetical protein